MMDFGKSRARMSTAEDQKIRFAVNGDGFDYSVVQRTIIPN